MFFNGFGLGLCIQIEGDTAGHVDLLYFVYGDVLFYWPDLEVSEERAKGVMMKHFLFLSKSVRCSIVSGESFEGDVMRMVSAFNLKAAK